MSVVELIGTFFLMFGFGVLLVYSIAKLIAAVEVGEEH